MMHFRVSAVLSFVVLAAGLAFGQAVNDAGNAAFPAANAGSASFKAPDYTSLPTTYAEYKVMKDEADWYLKAFTDPLTVIKGDQNTALKALNMQTWDLRNILQQPPEAARLVISKSLVAKAGNDPYFEAAMHIANIQSSDSILAVEAIQVLVDALRSCITQYPKVREPAKRILLAKLDDPRMGVRYVAVTGLGLLGSSPAPPDVVQALIKQLDATDDVVVDAAATALGNLGDTSAVRPLVTKFQKLPENVDAASEPEDKTAHPTGMNPSDQPVNQTRLSIAIAVDRLAKTNLGFSGLQYRDDVLARYNQLNDWWEASKDKYP